MLESRKKEIGNVKCLMSNIWIENRQNPIDILAFLQCIQPNLSKLNLRCMSRSINKKEAHLTAPLWLLCKIFRLPRSLHRPFFFAWVWIRGAGSAPKSQRRWAARATIHRVGVVLRRWLGRLSRRWRTWPGWIIDCEHRTAWFRRRWNLLSKRTDFGWEDIWRSTVSLWGFSSNRFTPEWWQAQTKPTHGDEDRSRRNMLGIRR